MKEADKNIIYFYSLFFRKSFFVNSDLCLIKRNKQMHDRKIQNNVLSKKRRSEI